MLCGIILLNETDTPFIKRIATQKGNQISCSGQATFTVSGNMVQLLISRPPYSETRFLMIFNVNGSLCQSIEHLLT